MLDLSIIFMYNSVDGGGNMNIFRYRPLAVLCAVYVAAFIFSFFVSAFIKAVLITVCVIVSVVLAVKRNNYTAVCICVILAMIYGYLYFDVHVKNSEELAGTKECVSFKVVDVSFINGNIAYLDGKLITDDKNNGDICHFTVTEPGDLEIGDVVYAEAEFFEIEYVEDFDAERYYHSKDIWIEGKVYEPTVIDHKYNFFDGILESIRDYCSACFEKYTDGDTSVLLNALAIGDKSEIDDSVKRDFRRLGLSHMLAISGMHLAVIMGCLMTFTDLLRINKRVGIAAVSTICFTYIFISGASSSVVRAGIMFLIMSLGTVIRRKGDSLTNLFVALFLITVFSPSSVFDVGLILSFTSTLGIITVVGPFMERRSSNSENGIVKRTGLVLVTPVLTTLSAMVFSFIPLISFFDETSMISVLSNLCLGPAVTLILLLIPCFLLLSFLPFVPTVLGFYLDLISDVIYLLVQILASVPNAGINLNYPFMKYTLIGAAVGVILLFVFRRRNVYLMPYLCWFLSLCICLISFNSSFGKASDVVFYSESGSDAILVRKGMSSIYLDLGRGSNAAQKRAFSYIDDLLYTKEIDCWIMTCYSDESVRSVNEYINNYYVRNILLPKPRNGIEEVCLKEIRRYTDSEKVKVSYYEYGKEFICNENSYTVYSPISFEDSKVLIVSADIVCNGKRISYYGCGYFDYGAARGECDYLYVGEKGTKRKQVCAPKITAGLAVIAEGNDVSAGEIDCDRITNLNDDNNFIKLRIG